MELKIFSAKYINKNLNSFQEERKLTRADFAGEIWIFAGFKQDNGKMREMYQKIVNSFEQSFFQNKSEDIFERLEESLKIVNDSIKDTFNSFGLFLKEEHINFLNLLDPDLSFNYVSQIIDFFSKRLSLILLKCMI